MAMASVHCMLHATCFIYIYIFVYIYKYIYIYTCIYIYIYSDTKIGLGPGIEPKTPTCRVSVLLLHHSGTPISV